MCKKILVILLFHLWAVPIVAQADTVWVRRYNGPGNDYDEAHAMALDALGNVYVTGGSMGDGTSCDYVTIKYDSSGNELWVRRYNGPGNSWDAANAMALDESGNVYVTGQSRGDGTYDDYATIKYDPDGNELWVRRYNGPYGAFDKAHAIALDAGDNVLVTGESDGDWVNSDCATIKYDPSGNVHWVRRYSGPENPQDGAYAIAVDAFGYAYVAGTSGSATTNYDFLTMKYYPNGDTAWVRTYNGASSGPDEACAVAVDDSGNVCVTGRTWIWRIWDEYDYLTVKYNALGDVVWAWTYNGPEAEAFDDEALAMAVDASGNVLVTGESRGDYGTLCYAPDGGWRWVRRYDGTKHAADRANALAVDDSGNVYVTGESAALGTVTDYATISYRSNGDVAWTAVYDGPASGYDGATAIAVDGFGHVYVTGASEGVGTDDDIATIKYIVLTGFPGDANNDGIIDIGDVVYLINYLYKNGSIPEPLEAGDANCDGIVDVGDVVYLINYLYKGGDPPSC